ncbi:O-antigen ligase family protein [bacterium]|nr:O-antigen ligase family protein [bacterium]
MMSKQRRNATSAVHPEKPLRCRPAAGLLGLLWLGVALVPASEAFVQPYADVRWLVVIAGFVGVLALIGWNERGEMGAGGWTEIMRGRDPLALGAILIVAGLVISSAFSPNPGLGLRIGAREAFMAGAAYCISRRAFRSSEIRLLVWCLIIATGIQAATGLFQAFAQGAGRTAMHGTLEQSEALCDFLGAGTAAAAILAMKNGSRSVMRAVALAVAAIGAAAIFIAGGRGGALSAAIAIVLALFVLPAPSRNGFNSPLGRVAFPAFAILLVLLIAIGFGLLSQAGRSNTLASRLVEMFDPHSVPVRHRIGLVVISGNMVMDRPLTGSGPGRFAAGFSDMQGRLALGETGKAFWSFNEMLSRYSPNEAHCDPFQWWAEYGLLPCLGLLLMIASAMISGAGIIRKDIDPCRAALWAALMAWSVVMWFSYPLHDPSAAVCFWGLAGVVAGRTEEQAL